MISPKVEQRIGRIMQVGGFAVLVADLIALSVIGYTGEGASFGKFIVFSSIGGLASVSFGSLINQHGSGREYDMSRNAASN